MKLPKWLTNISLYVMDVLNDDSENREDWIDARLEHLTEDPNKANLIGSKIAGQDKHFIFIDLDVEHFYTPSSTPGHGHLIINEKVSKARLIALMKVLESYNIVGPGWVYQIEARGENTLRTPNSKKILPLEDVEEWN